MTVRRINDGNTSVAKARRKCSSEYQFLEKVKNTSLKCYVGQTAAFNLEQGNRGSITRKKEV